MDKLHDGQSRSGDFIDLNDAYQVTQWSEIFNITKEDLRETVERVGTRMVDVRAHIKARRKLRGQ